MIMLAQIELEPIALAARTIHKIADARGTTVTCVTGIAWITQERDPRDLILEAGQSVVLDRPGTAIVYAMQDLLITLGQATQLPKAAGRPLAPVHADRAVA
jgi:hypothetical protein